MTPLTVAIIITCALASIVGVIYGINHENEQVLWSHDLKIHIFAPVIRCEGLCIFGSEEGLVHAIQDVDGEIKWQEKFSFSVNAGICPMNDDKIMIMDTKSHFKIIDATKERTICAGALGIGETFSTPMMIRDKVLIGSRDDHLYCFDSL